MSGFVPLRKFIFDRLYNPAGGYFCRKGFQPLIQIFKWASLPHQSISNLSLGSTTTNRNYTNDIRRMLGWLLLKFSNHIMGCQLETILNKLSRDTWLRRKSIVRLGLLRQGLEQAVQLNQSYITFKTTSRMHLKHYSTP